MPRNLVLYTLKLWEIRAIIRGYRNRFHTTWESTRWQTFCILCALGNKKLNSPKDLIEFPWEKDWSDMPTVDEVEELRREMMEMNNNNQESDDND